MLWACVVPATRDDLPEVTGKLARVLVAADRQWPGVLAAPKMTDWPAIISKLRPIADGLGYPITPVDARHLGKRGGDTGHRQRNALYSAFLALPDTGSEYADRCELLMAHVFLAHFKILSTPAGTKLSGGLVKGDTSITAYEAYAGAKPWPALTISPKNCCLALRGMFCGEEWARAVVAAYPVDLHPSRFVAYAGLVFEGELLQHEKSKDWLEKQEDYLLIYLAQAYGLKPRHRGRGQSPQLDGRKSGAGTEDGAKAAAAFRHDVCPDEDEGDDDINDNGDPDSEPSDTQTKKPHQRNQVGSKGKRKTGKGRKGTGNAAGVGSDQAIRASKGFPFAPDRLSPVELSVIDIDCRHRAEGILAQLQTTDPTSEAGNVPAPSEQALRQEVELLLYVLVMLWTNSDLERTQGLRIYLAEQCKDRIPFAILMPADSEGSNARIRIYVTFPPDAPRREPLPPYDRDRSEYVVLPDAAELGPLLWSFLADRDGVSTLKASSQVGVFRQPVEYYYEHVPRLLEERGGDRLSVVPLASALYHEILNWSNKDTSAATMITGELRLKARVQMFYAVRRMKRLQEIYAGTVRYLRAAISLTQPHAENGNYKSNGLSALMPLQRQTGVQTPFVPAPDDEKYVAINACPTDKAMQKAVQDFIGKVEDLWLKPTSANWIEAHNLYTYYVIWFFGFVTGARPIASPILRPSEIDEPSMCGRFQDKGLDKARLVWITDQLLAQLKFYEAYIGTTRLATLTKHPCWFLDRSGSPLPACEEICEPILHRFLPGFPTNIHRRWMFNALLDSGCPYVAEWAGHFLTGNRLVGRGATASPSMVGQQVLQYVRPIMDYLGFRTIKVGLL
jgi:hypothetical protein